MKPKFGLLALITILTTFSMPLSLNLRVPLSMPNVSAQTLDTRKAEAGRLLDQGRDQNQVGQFQAALQSWQQALTIYRQIGDRKGEAYTLNNMGSIYKDLGQYSQALELRQQALAISRAVRDRSIEMGTLVNLGAIYRSLGQYSQAMESYQQALDIARERGKPETEWMILIGIGNVYSSVGSQSPRALQFYQQALAIARKIGDRQLEGLSLSKIGYAYHHQSQYSQALKFYEQALAIRGGHHASDASILQNMGEIYIKLGQYQQAEKFLLLALNMFNTNGDRGGLSKTLASMGRVLLHTGKFAEAEEVLHIGIEMEESLRTGLSDVNKVSLFDTQLASYILLQQALIAQEKTNAALEVAERGRARAFVELLASRLSSQSAPLATITPPKIQQIKQIAKEQKATLVEYSIIFDDFKGGKLKSFILIWAVKPTGDVAFRQVELEPFLKEHTSLTQVSNSPAVVTAPSQSPAITTIALQIGQQFSISWRHPGAIALVIVIGSSFIGIGVWCGRFVLIKKAAQNSKEKCRWFVPWLLLVLAVGCSGGFFFWITRSQPIIGHSNLRGSSLLADLVSNTRKSFGVDRRGLGIVPKGQNVSQTDDLHQLHQLLIQPIADFLPTNPEARVIFIPQNFLFLVPFPALKDASGKYLIEKHTILTAPSIQTLDLTRKQKQRIESLGVGSREALVVGNPTMPKVPPQIGEPQQQLPSLPGAEEEAKAIASLLKTQAITGNGATKQAILQKMSGARIVHLATHGLLDDIRGLGSAIALAPSGKDDGLLTAEQILDLRLNAELVVLSACDTGLGKITGDGVIGLSRSLITAGVPSVLVSLWSVPDAPTASLMTEFYRNLQKNPDKAQALRQAMLTTMKQHPDPRDWAAFTLIGEAQ